jgi:thiol-disulfide isomerase/thioredoxin
MAFLVATVVLVGLLAAVNLVFTLAVVRRLREHTELISKMGTAGSMRGATMLPAGQSVGAYTATTVDGATLSADDRDGPELVGFFSLGCQPCAERLPEFVASAADHPGGRHRVLAVVAGRDDEGDAQAFVDDLALVARVVREDMGGPLQKAFAVQGYPAIGVVDESGVVVVSGTTMPDLAPANA